MIGPFLEAATLLFVLLNPFLMTIYLLDLISQLDGPTFRKVMFRGTCISFVVFSIFALTGDAVFRDVLQVRFAAFLVFGGVIFLIIAVRFVMLGTEAITQLRGDPQYVAGSVAMPFMIGPGTISASVLAGAHLPSSLAVAAVATALMGTALGVFVLKGVHDWVRKRHESLVQRYVDMVGRIAALVIGTISIEMLMQGVERWARQLGWIDQLPPT